MDIQHGSDEYLLSSNSAVKDAAGSVLWVLSLHAIASIVNEVSQSRQ